MRGVQILGQDSPPERGCEPGPRSQEGAVEVTLTEDQEFFRVGVSERHQTSKIAIMHPEMFDWLFSQSKN